MSDSKLSCSREVIGRCVFAVMVGLGGLKKRKTSFFDGMMTFSGAHQKKLGGGWQRGVQATERASLLLALLLKKICALLCVCLVGGGVLVLFIYLFPTQTWGL